jgi:hypothetical protein
MALDGAFKVNIHGTERRRTLKISRADVAGLLAGCLGESTLMHRAASISH